MSAPMPGHAQKQSFEQESAAFVQRYLQEWSGPASSALDFMNEIYLDKTEFYGQVLTHAALMNIKRKATMRWPERTLHVRPNSIETLCTANHLCTVQAIFDWHYSSPERQAASSGSASLKLELKDGMTILSENGAVITSNTPALPALVQPTPANSVPTQSASPHDLSEKPGAAPVPQQSALASLRDEPNPQRDEIDALRTAYAAHAADKDWITAWFAQKRDFSGAATVAGFSEDQAGPSPTDVLRTVDFASNVGTIACINPDNISALKVGEKVNIQGVITIFIDDAMYLGQCSVQPEPG